MEVFLQVSNLPTGCFQGAPSQVTETSHHCGAGLGAPTEVGMGHWMGCSLIHGPFGGQIQKISQDMQR